MAKLPVKGGPWLIEGKRSDKVLIARAMVTPSEKGIPIRIANTSMIPVSLYQGAKVATAELITEASVNAVTEPPSEKSAMESPKHISLSTNLLETQNEGFLQLLSHYSDLFAKDNDDLGCTNVMKHQIETGTAKPICCKLDVSPCLVARKCKDCCRTHHFTV